MKDQKGITLITLVITIIVMSILAGVVTYSGIQSVNDTKRMAFISELEMIQAKVNIIYEKRKTSEEELNYYNQLGIDASTIEDSKLTTALGETSKEGFRYFSISDLRAIGLDNINQEVLINYDTREVVSITGIEIDGVMYYKLKDIPNYSGYNVEYTNTNTEAPTFNVEVTRLSDSYRLTLKDIVYNSNVTGGTVSYKLHNDTNWVLNGTDTSFEVSQKGLYNVRYTDKAGNSTIQDIYIEDEVFREEFDSFNYETARVQVNSCTNSILDVTATDKDPWIYMYDITKFNPLEYRYIEVKYKTINTTYLQLNMVENATDTTYAISTLLQTNGEWNTLIIDLWKNENIKNKTEINGWILDLDGNQEGSIRFNSNRLYSCILRGGKINEYKENNYNNSYYISNSINRILMLWILPKSICKSTKPNSNNGSRRIWYCENRIISKYGTKYCNKLYLPS